MTARTKISIASFTGSVLMLLVVFSKPLHIPDPLQWVFIAGLFVSSGLMFYFLKQHKKQTQAAVPGTPPVSAAAQLRQKSRRNLLLAMVLGSVVGLCSPLWLPLTGTTLGFRGDLICGIITAVVVCAICGYRMSRI